MTMARKYQGARDDELENVIRVRGLPAMGRNGPGESGGAGPAVKIHVIGSASNSNIYQALEHTFWTEQLPRAQQWLYRCRPVFDRRERPHDPQIARLLGLGALDVAYGDLASIAGDVREFEGIDLAGVITDIDTMHRAADAYKPVIDRIFNQHGVSCWASFRFRSLRFIARDRSRLSTI